MSHEMLTLQARLLNGHEAICVWAVIENWSVDEEGGHNELLYANQADAIRAFHSQLAIEANEGCIYRWKDREDFQFERNPLSYECWLDGDYCSNHYEILLEEKPVILRSPPNRSRKNL